MGLTRRLTELGVKPSGPLGWVVAWTMPLMFRSVYAGIARRLDLRPDDDVLDVACGSGAFLQQYAAGSRRVAGLDHSGIQVGMARDRLRARIDAGTAEIVRGDSAALPWADDAFSAVTSDCVGCFARPVRSLEEMRRVLRPGGRMVLSVDYYPDEAAARKAERQWGLPTWTEAGLRAILDEAGFADVTLEREGSTLFATAARPQAPTAAR
jgi:SAM-dependent methyltransferase